MHELSIALNVMDIVKEELTQSGCTKVTEVVIEVGDLSGVDTMALTTCLDIASKDSFMHHAAIKIIRHPGKGYCNTCKKEYAMADILDLCPDCGSAATQITEGNEMQIPSIVVVE
jgi:hydrogenase nickel incorporation protein HypA/HybF